MDLFYSWSNNNLHSSSNLSSKLTDLLKGIWIIGMQKELAVKDL